MSQLREKFHWLHQLFSSTFHQDWHDEGLDYLQRLNQYIDGLPREYLENIRAGLIWMLEQRASDEELFRMVCDDLESNCCPDPPGVRGWLLEVLLTVEDEIRRT